MRPTDFGAMRCPVARAMAVLGERWAMLILREAFCGTTRHEGIATAEAGADYVAFGPVGATPLGDGSLAEMDLFQWWSEMIEVPVVAEGALTADLVAKLGPVTDFLGVGEEIWSEDDPAVALRALLAPLG